MTPLLDKDRESISLDLGDKVALQERQAIEILDRTAELCGLIRAMDEAPSLVVGLESPFNTSAGTLINLALLWGKSVV